MLALWEGLGARSAAEQVPAAYVASLSACWDLLFSSCGQLLILSTLMVGVTYLLPRSACLARLPHLSRPCSPQAPSSASRGLPDPRGRLLADCHPGLLGHACLLAPLSGRPATPPPRGPLWNHDTARGMCGEVLTTPSPAAVAATDSSATTPFATSFARRSPNSPRFRLSERSPGCFLHPRCPDPGGAGFVLDPFIDPSSPACVGRRPADIWIPRGVSGFAEGLDFSVSSLLRTSHISSTTPSVADVFHEVETLKNTFQDTASQVAARGPTFCPHVLEASGRGWSQALREVVAWISSESRASRDISVGLPRDTSLRIAQRVGCTLHRARQRMALQGWLATRLMGLAGEVHGWPWFCGGSWFVLGWCATPSGVLSSRTVCHVLAAIAFVPGFSECALFNVHLGCRSPLSFVVCCFSL